MALTWPVLFSLAALSFLLRQRDRAYTTVRLVEMSVSTCRGGEGVKGRQGLRGKDAREDHTYWIRGKNTE